MISDSNENSIKSNENENINNCPFAHPLNECIFRGDLRKLSQLLRTNADDITKKDKHGKYF